MLRILTLLCAENISERVDTSVGGWNNAHALSAAPTHRWTCMGAKVQHTLRLFGNYEFMVHLTTFV